MSVLETLPDRPLTDGELATFNRSDALELAVDVTSQEGQRSEAIAGLLLATES